MWRKEFVVVVVWVMLAATSAAFVATEEAPAAVAVAQSEPAAKAGLISEAVKAVRERFKVRRSSVPLRSKDDVTVTLRPRNDVATIKTQKVKHTHDVARSRNPVVAVGGGKAPEVVVVNVDGWNKKEEFQKKQKQGLIRSRLPPPMLKAPEDGLKIVEVVKSGEASGENTDDVIRMKPVNKELPKIAADDAAGKARNPALFKSSEESMEDATSPRMRAPTATTTTRVHETSSSSSFEHTDDVIRPRFPPALRSQERAVDTAVAASASVDVIQDRIDVVADDVVPSVRLRVVELEMFKCHRGCMLAKNVANVNVTSGYNDDDDIDDDVSEQCDLADLDETDSANGALRFYNACICSCKVQINQKRLLCLQGRGSKCPKANPGSDNLSLRSRVRSQRRGQARN